MSSQEILDNIQELIEYCKSDEAKRSYIIKKLKELKGNLNSILPFD